GGSGFGGNARLVAVIVALEAGDFTDGRIVFWPSFADRGRRACEIGAESTRLDDRHFDAARADLLGNYLGETFDAPLRSCIGGSADRPYSTSNRGELED